MLDKIKNIALIVLTAIVVSFFIFKSCGKPKPITPINIPELERQDSFRTIIKYHDSTRLHHINKWRTITRITDSTPCYTEVLYVTALCDTVIKYDSILIVALKQQHINDTIIQTKLFDRVRTDSVLITKLNRKVRRNRTLAKLAFITGLGLGGVVGVKVSK